MNQYRNYTIQQGDSLESIAANQLGSADRWREIAILNRLRQPFISDDSYQKFGLPIVTGVLTAVITANDRTYMFQPSELPVYQSTYAANTVFYLQSIDALGTVTYDAMPLAVAVVEATGLLAFTPSVSLSISTAITTSAVAQAVNVTNTTGVSVGTLLQVDFAGSQETVTITQVTPASADVQQITAVFTKNHLAGTLASYGFQHSYPLGTSYTMFPPVRDTRLKVVGTGSTIALPIAANAGQVGSTNDSTFASLLGSDILIGLDGTIQFGVNGGVQRVSGVQNLEQALRIRLTTPLNSYSHYATYGNALWDFIGQNTEPYFIVLVQNLVKQALLADPRVGSVNGVTTTVNGRTINIDAQVQILDSSQLIRLDNLVITL